MRELFDQLVSEGEAGIDRLIAEKMQENVHLDFKRKFDATHGRFDRDDRKSLGQALSAFSNSDGGLLVFGVDARKNEDGIDCAVLPPYPISDIEAFRSAAEGLLGQLLSPKHDGIYINHIPSDRLPGAGYLLVSVERSERRPHMSLAADDKHYWKRSGSSSFQMEHYDIEDAFNRRTAPALKLTWLIRQGSGSINEMGYFEANLPIVLNISNQSTSSARYPYFQIRPLAKPLIFQNKNPMKGLSFKGEEDGWYYFAGTADDVIHPDQDVSTAVFTLRASYPVQKMHYVRASKLKLIGEPSIEDFTVKWRIGCVDSRMLNGELNLSSTDLVQAAARTGLPGITDFSNFPHLTPSSLMLD